MNRTILLTAGLWDPLECYYFDRLTEHREGKAFHHKLKIRSMVGLVPLFGATELTDLMVNQRPKMKKALQSAMEQTQFVNFFYNLLALY